MERFEKLAFPIIIAVAVAAVLLVQVDAGVVTVIAKVVGITLVVLLVLGFVARSVVKVRRAKAETAAMLAEMERLRRELGESGAEGREPGPTP